MRGYENILVNATSVIPYRKESSMSDLPMERAAKNPSSFFQEMREQFAKEFSMLDDAVNNLNVKVQYVCVPDSPAPTDPNSQAEATTDLEAFANESLNRIRYARYAIQSISDRVKL